MVYLDKPGHQVMSTKTLLHSNVVAFKVMVLNISFLIVTEIHMKMFIGYGLSVYYPTFWLDSHLLAFCPPIN